jgi:hypothetical protein
MDSPPVQLDMTSEYIDLKFRGFLEISQTSSHCVYKFPSLMIEMRGNRDAHKRSAYIRHIQMTVAMRTNPSGKQSYEERKPIPVISLERAGASSELRDVEFRIAKEVAADVDYIAFGVGGSLLLEVNDERLAAEIGRVRTDLVSWPIRARSNILQIVTDAYGERGYVVRKTPDPADCCAPEKVR